MYNVILWKDNGNEDIHVFDKKPTFDQLYGLIGNGCSLIQIISGYNPDISSRTFDMYCDEESKFNTECYPNKRATNAWYEWQKRTKRQCLPGDYISGNVCIVKKLNVKLKDAA